VLPSPTRANVPRSKGLISFFVDDGLKLFPPPANCTCGNRGGVGECFLCDLFDSFLSCLIDTSGSDARRVTSIRDTGTYYLSGEVDGSLVNHR
jgi:hypothetical protein